MLGWTSAQAVILGPEVVDPFTVRSPSGAYVVRVSPGDRAAVGPSTIKFTERGKVLWIKKFPYTLREAVVDDEGRIGGYGYSGSRVYNPRGALYFVVLNRKGAQITCDSFRLYGPYNTGSMAYPSVSAFTGDPVHHRFVVETGQAVFADDPGPIPWCLYDLRTGRQMINQKGATGVLRLLTHTVVDVRLTPIKGSDLIAGYRIEGGASATDDRPRDMLRVTSAFGKLICQTRILPSDLADPKDPTAPNQSWHELNLSSGRANQITVDIPDFSRRITFELRRPPTGGSFVRRLGSISLAKPRWITDVAPSKRRKLVLIRTFPLRRSKFSAANSGLVSVAPLERNHFAKAGSREASLQDSRLHRIAELERRADGCWIGHVRPVVVAVASNGEAALLEPNLQQQDPCFITIINKGGAPIHSFSVNATVYSPRLAFDGNTVLVFDQLELRAFSVRGDPLWKTTVGTSSFPSMDQVRLRNGLLYGVDGSEVRVYRMPTTGSRRRK